MPLCSAVIITKNEADRVRPSLESLCWADEIVVVDSGSTDGTVLACHEFTDKVFVRAFDNFAAQRNAALEQVTGDWIFVLDADEVVTPDLAREIQETIRTPAVLYTGYYVRRQNYLCGQPVHHVWGDDRLVRLFRRDSGLFINDVHEKVRLSGSAGILRYPLLHYNSTSLKAYIRKNDLYTRLDAQQRHARGEKGSYLKLLLAPACVFLFRFVTLRGYKDGGVGLILSCLLAYFTFRLHMHLLALHSPHRGSAYPGPEI